VGDAFKQGMGMARYDAVVSLDMDLSIHLSFVGGPGRECFSQ
jgi:hypothetical protein